MLTCKKLSSTIKHNKMSIILRSSLGLFLTLFLLFTLQSCFYVPTAVNTPLFTKKGQTVLSYQGLNSRNIQAAYALTDNWGIMTNYSFYPIENNEGILSLKKELIDYNFKGNANMIEIAGGFSKNKNLRPIGFVRPLPSKFIMEIYGGFGTGTSTFNGNSNIIDTTNKTGSVFNKNVYNMTMTTNKLFLQPSIAWQNNLTEIILTSRITYLDFIKSKSTLPLNELNLTDFGNALKHNYLVISPSFTGRIGYKGVKLQYQFAYHFSVNENKTYQKIYGAPVSLHFGTIFRINSKKL